MLSLPGNPTGVISIGILQNSSLDILNALFLTIFFEIIIAFILIKFLSRKGLLNFFYSIGKGLIILIIFLLLLSTLNWISGNFMFNTSDMDIYDRNAFLSLSTILIESLLLFISIGYFYYKKNYLLLTVILINIITNPLLNFFILITEIHNMVLIVLLEILVVFVEYNLLNYTLGNENDKSIFNTPFYKQKNFILALSINAGSFLIGLLIFS